MDYAASDITLTNAAKVNVILGKNGCGKSTLLKKLDQGMTGTNLGIRRYITPERGGILSYEAGIEQNIVSNPGWLGDTRRVNQFNQFKQQSTVQFRQLETLVLRAAERVAIADFQPYVERLNRLLDNIEIRRDDPAFKMYSLRTGQPIEAAQISSGESELIALGIEMLKFSKERTPGKDNVLILDEPDVHLHPDLQHRLTKFLCDIVDEGDTTVVLATHSTAILGGLSNYSSAAVAFMKAGDTAINFEPLDDVHRRVLPVFGAHPLSNVFNEAPVLIVEGDDDERIWQQAVRSSSGSVNVYPVSCGDGVSAINAFERDVDRIVGAVYDNGVAYSLRDGDGTTDPITDQGTVVRFRLNCRAAENLMLTDEVLAIQGITFEDVKTRIDDWLSSNGTHSRHDSMNEFRLSGYDRQQFDLKDIRMIIAGQVLGTNKPWEVLVGQVLATYRAPNGTPPYATGSLAEFLGSKLVSSPLIQQAT